MTGDSVLVVVTLNAYSAEQGTPCGWTWGVLAMQRDDRFTVHDEVTGEEYQPVELCSIEPWRVSLTSCACRRSRPNNEPCCCAENDFHRGAQTPDDETRATESPFLAPGSRRGGFCPIAGTHHDPHGNLGATNTAITPSEC